MLLFPGCECERLCAGQWGGGQRGAHLRRVPGRVLQPVQLSPLRSRLLRAMSSHACEEPANNHSLPSLPRPHLTHGLSQRRALSLMPNPLSLTYLLIIWQKMNYKFDSLLIIISNFVCVQHLKCICWFFFTLLLLFSIFSTQQHSKDGLPKSLLRPQAELPECSVCQMASAQLSQTLPYLLGWETETLVMSDEYFCASADTRQS